VDEITMTDDEVRDAAIALYEKERKVGWDASWVNAGAATWRKYVKRVLDGERA
jgi:hypothetical protein